MEKSKSILETVLEEEIALIEEEKKEIANQIKHSIKP